MAAEKKCCVPTCGSNSTILHKFPNPMVDIINFRKWVKKIGGDLLSLEYRYIYKNLRVCTIHFELLYFRRNSRLSAPPTLCLPAFSKQLPVIDVGIDVLYNFFPELNDTNIKLAAQLLTADTVKDKLKYITHVDNMHQQMHSKDKNTTKKSKNSTETKKSLFKKLIKLVKKYNVYKKQFKKKSKSYINVTFLQDLKKLKSAPFTAQLKENTEPKMGRKITKEEKFMSLKVYKHNPKFYRWLSHIYWLPSSAYLKRKLAKRKETKYKAGKIKRTIFLKFSNK